MSARPTVPVHRERLQHSSWLGWGFFVFDWGDGKPRVPGSPARDTVDTTFIRSAPKRYAVSTVTAETALRSAFS